MKVKTLEKKATSEITEDDEKRVKKMIKTKLKDIKGCEKTLRLMQKDYKEFLAEDIDDLELDNKCCW